MDKKIIVFGATGNLGVKICEELDSCQLPHTTFVRKGSEHKIKTKLSDLFQGDVLQKTNIESVFSSTVYSDIIIALGSRDFKAGNVRSIGTKHIVELLKEKVTKSKLHVISAHGVGDSWDSLKWYEKMISKLLINKTMKDHELQESLVLTNAGGYHIIRPVALSNSESTGNVFSNDNGPVPNGYISRADVAKYLVEGINANKYGISSICNE